MAMIRNKNTKIVITINSRFIDNAKNLSNTMNKIAPIIAAVA